MDASLSTTFKLALYPSPFLRVGLCGCSLTLATRSRTGTALENPGTILLAVLCCALVDASQHQQHCSCSFLRVTLPRNDLESVHSAETSYSNHLTPKGRPPVQQTPLGSGFAILVNFALSLSRLRIAGWHWLCSVSLPTKQLFQSCTCQSADPGSHNRICWLHMRIQSRCSFVLWQCSSTPTA